MPIIGQDDRFFLTDSGGRIAKSGLSQDKAMQLQGLLPQPQMTPVPALQAPMMSTVPAPAAAPLWEQPAAYTASSPAQLNMEPAQQVSTGPVDSVDTQTATGLDIGAVGQKYLNSINDGLNMQMQGEQKIANAKARMGQDLLEEQRALDRRQAQFEWDLQQERDQANMRIAEATSKLDTLRSDYAANNKVDPDRFFKGNTGKRIMAGIAIAFGELGRGLTGGSQNAALNIIQSAIDNDIDAQKEEIAGRQTQVAQAREGLTDVRALFKDRIDAQAAQKVMFLEQAQRKFEQIASRYGTEEAKAVAQKNIGALEVKKAELIGGLLDRASKDVTKTETQNLSQIKDIRERLVPGYGIALTEADAKEIKTAAAERGKFNKMIDEMINLREKHKGGTISDRVDVARGKQLSKDLLLSYKNMAKLGVLSQADEAIINAIIPADPLQYNDPLSASKGVDPTLNRLREFKKDVEMQFNESLDVRMMQRFQNADPSQLSSFTPRGQEPKQKTGTANVMPGR